ncbi:hypothetical protein H0H93_015572 [Arthromyces matolae]|nr:hypothetical protein H0H93_015572 [Arthromyces matolae]
MKPTFVAISILCISATPVASVTLPPSLHVGRQLVTESEEFLRTTLKAYDVLVDVEAGIDLNVADNGTKLGNLQHVVFEALVDISTETLCTAFESREEAHITEKNGTELIKLLTRLARKTIDHPQRGVRHGDWAVLVKEKLISIAEYNLNWSICTVEDDKTGVKWALKALANFIGTAPLGLQHGHRHS